MPSHSDRLPIAVTPYPTESGIGFMLRVASANAMSLAKLRQLVGMGENETFNAHHEVALMGLVGLTAELRSNLLPHGARHGVGNVACYGHHFRIRAMLRTRRPQVCLACVRDAAYCEAHWDLSLSVLCLRHRCLLQDKCPSCGASLRWARPSVEWSHCKHYLGRDVGVQEIPVQITIAQQITHDLFYGKEPDFGFLGMACPGISLDAWLSLLWALGAMDAAFVSPRRGALIAAPSAADACGMVLRAVTRIQRCQESGKGLHDLRNEVVEAPLLGTILNPVGRRDRALAMGWYAAIFGEREAEALALRHREIAQMSLF